MLFGLGQASPAKPDKRSDSIPVGFVFEIFAAEELGAGDPSPHQRTCRVLVIVIVTISVQSCGNRFGCSCMDLMLRDFEAVGLHE